MNCRLAVSVSVNVIVIVIVIVSALNQVDLRVQQ
jgi:hypothetical protein